MSNDSREIAARLYFWLEDCAEELENKPDKTEADKRHALALKTEAIVTKDRIIDARVKRVGGRA